MLALLWRRARTSAARYSPKRSAVVAASCDSSSCASGLCRPGNAATRRPWISYTLARLRKVMFGATTPSGWRQNSRP